MTLRHHIYALLVVFIWGTNFVFIRYGLDELESFTFVAIRFALVAFPLVLFLPRPAASWVSLIAYGLFIGAGQFGLLFWAMENNIAPGMASLVVQTQVFFTVFLTAVFFNESVTRLQLVSLVVSFTGLMMIILYTDAHTTLFGVMLTLLAAAAWACGNLVVKKAGQVHVLAYIAWSSLLALPFLFALALYADGFSNIAMSLSNMSAQGWAVILWQSVGNTLIGYGLWNFLLSRYQAAVVTPWALMVPVFGMSASSIMLAEPMPAWKLLAASLILLGLVLAVMGPRFSALRKPR